MKKSELKKLEDEALKIAHQLRKFCIKYGYDYMTAAYVDDTVMANTSPYDKKNQINVWEDCAGIKS